MEISFSNRLKLVPPYLFVEVRRKIAQAKARGIDVITFAVGDPVEPTPSEIIQELNKQSGKVENHCYPPGESAGMQEFRGAVSEWYNARFGVNLDPEQEVLALIGSKEGSHHLALSTIDPGDYAIVPDPAYTTYEMSTLFAGGKVFKVPLLEKNNFLPDLESIPEDVAWKSKLFFINYPNNPTGAIMNQEFLRDVVEFAHKYQVVVVCDNPYSEITYDGYIAPSFLEVDGAKEIGIEFNSLSKPFNMTGWRIGMAVGNKDVLKAIKVLKDNTDSGPFAAIQLAAVAALKNYSKHKQHMCQVYARRRGALIKALPALGLDAKPPKATFYVWASIKDGTPSMEFTNNLIDKLGIVAIPGIGYGKHGEGYVRFSLTIPDDHLEEAITRINKGAI